MAQSVASQEDPAILILLLRADSQRAENGGLDPSWLNFVFLGRPFQSRGPQILYLKGFGASGRKIGAPQKRENQP